MPRRLMVRVHEELLEKERPLALGDLHPADVLSLETDDTDLAGDEPRIEIRGLPRLVPSKTGSATTARMLSR
jgi:hypothetical protein